MVIEGSFITQLDYVKYFRESFESEIANLGDSASFSTGLGGTDDGTELGGSGKAVRDTYGILGSFQAGNDGTAPSPTTVMGQTGKDIRDNGLYTGNIGINTQNHKSETYASGTADLSTTVGAVTVARMENTGDFDRFSATLLVTFNGQDFVCFDVALDGGKTEPVIRPRYISSQAPTGRFYEAYILYKTGADTSSGIKINMRVVWNTTQTVSIAVHVLKSYGNNQGRRSIVASTPATTSVGTLPDGSAGTASTIYDLRDTVIDGSLVTKDLLSSVSFRSGNSVTATPTGQAVTIGYIPAGRGTKIFRTKVEYTIGTTQYSGHFYVDGIIAEASSLGNIKFIAGSCNEGNVVAYVGKVWMLYSNDTTDRGAILQMELLRGSSGGTRLNVRLTSMANESGDYIRPVEPFDDASPTTLPDGTAFSSYQQTADWWRFGRGEKEIWSGSDNSGSITPFTGFTADMFDAYIALEGNISYLKGHSRNNSQQQQIYFRSAEADVGNTNIEGIEQVIFRTTSGSGVIQLFSGGFGTLIGSANPTIDTLIGIKF